MSNESQKSYVQYTALFNKVCSGPIFLALAALSSVYAVVSAISFFGALGNLIGMFFPLINFALSIVSTIAFWMIFLGAKKGNIKPSFFKLATACAKFVRGIASAITTGVTIASAIVIALIFALQETLLDICEWCSKLISEHGDAILDKESVKTLETFFDDAANTIENSAILLCIGCILLVVLFILSLIRFSKGIGFMKNVFETYTKGHMVAPPTMFVPVLSFIVAAFGLFLSCYVLSFDLLGIVYSLMIAVGGVLILLNKDELARIYTVWQKEMGMVTDDAAAAAAAPAPAATETPAE